MSNFDAVIFDFDGTVVDSGDGVFTSVRHALRVLNLEQPDDNAIRLFLGPPLDYGFKNVCGLDDETTQKAIKLYREYYGETGLYKFTVYGGIPELLSRLTAIGISTAIASAKPELFLRRITEFSGIDKLVGAVVGPSLSNTDTSKAGGIRRAIAAIGADTLEPDRILMVGDRCFDIESAAQVGIKSAAVLYGYGTKEEFEEAGADYIVKDTDELFKIIAG